MFTDEGKFFAFVVLFLIGIFASGYFMGWGRDKLSVLIWDKLIYHQRKAKYWEARSESLSTQYYELLDLYTELKSYTLNEVGISIVPEKFGGEFREESE